MESGGILEVRFEQSKPYPNAPQTRTNVSPAVEAAGQPEQRAEQPAHPKRLQPRAAPALPAHPRRAGPAARRAHLQRGREPADALQDQRLVRHGDDVRGVGLDHRGGVGDAARAGRGRDGRVGAVRGTEGGRVGPLLLLVVGGVGAGRRGGGGIGARGVLDQRGRGRRGVGVAAEQRLLQGRGLLATHTHRGDDERDWELKGRRGGCGVLF